MQKIKFVKYYCKKIFTLLLCLAIAGCSMGSLSRYEQQRWDELSANGVEPIEFKSKSKAITWDLIIPGSGSIYAGGFAKNWGWLVGGILLWPFTIPINLGFGASNAVNTNKRMTIEYHDMGLHEDRVKSSLPA